MKTIKNRIKSIKTTVTRKTINLTKPLHYSKPRQAAESQNKQGNKCVKPSHSKLSEIIISTIQKQRNHNTENNNEIYDNQQNRNNTSKLINTFPNSNPRKTSKYRTKKMKTMKPTHLNQQ